ncbi:MAG TPA: transcriptional regulator, partial [Clostridiales bacterium]|nr:transcriptional regulator [Clostridiales bacterium]
MEKLDYKKEYKDLYMPKTKPVLIDVPNMKFIMVKGKGNPNAENGEYQEALSILYGLSFTIKMSKMGTNKIDGYFEYVVPPLEGFWWNEGNKNVDYNHKEKFEWISMIRQPEFVTESVFEWALQELKK